MRLLLLNAFFFLAVTGAWAWYHVAPPAPPVRYSFSLNTNLNGFKFKSEPISEKAAKTLATTNLFNGTFYGPKGERITAFMGEWRAENSKEMSVVQHTPDVCWVGAGWMPVRSDHPSQITFDFEGTELPFEVRTFAAPSGVHRELTVWCTLVNGQVYEEIRRFASPDLHQDPRGRRSAGSRRLAASYLLNAISRRTAGTGDKQFIRFSATLAGDWQPVLHDLQAFAHQWLRLEVKGEEAGKGDQTTGDE